ncbi:MAG: hypothetical protein WCR02_07560, partial [Sphaerochaetaceae bacterium]
VGYDRAKDGSMSLAYADGMKAVIASDGATSVSLPNGILVSADAKGMTTSYMGTVITKAGIVGYDRAKDGSMSLTYADGMKAVIASDGATKVSLPNGLVVVATSSGVDTLYKGSDLTQEPIVGYALFADGSRKLEYKGDLFILSNAEGIVMSRGGVVVASGAEKETKVAPVVKEEKKPAGQAPVVKEEAKAVTSTKVVAPVEAAKNVSAFKVGVSFLPYFNSQGFVSVGPVIRAQYDANKNIYFGVESGVSAYINHSRVGIPVLGVAGIRANVGYVEAQIGAEFLDDKALLSLGAQIGVELQVNKNFALDLGLRGTILLNSGSLYSRRLAPVVGCTISF